MQDAIKACQAAPSRMMANSCATGLFHSAHDVVQVDSPYSANGPGNFFLSHHQHRQYFYPCLHDPMVRHHICAKIASIHAPTQILVLMIVCLTPRTMCQYNQIQVADFYGPCFLRYKQWFKGFQPPSHSFLEESVCELVPMSIAQRRGCIWIESATQHVNEPIACLKYMARVSLTPGFERLLYLVS